MTEHSIEELQRQLKAAQDRRQAAENDVRAAAARLQTAQNEASGIIGHVLEFKRTRGYGRTAKEITRRILVETVRPGYGGMLRAYGKIIIASGEVGLMRDDVVITEATDLGPRTAA